MNNTSILLMVVLVLFVAGMSLFKQQIIDFLLKAFSGVVKFLLAIKTRHQLETLRKAIHDADKDKAKTGRKNMVIYNSTKKKFEPVQKKLLKQVNQVQKKNKSSRTLDPKRIHQIEKKSLYVTR